MSTLTVTRMEKVMMPQYTDSLESAAFYQFEYFLGSLPGAVKAGSILHNYPADKREYEKKERKMLYS